MVSPFFGAPLWLCAVAVLLAELLLPLLLLVDPQAVAARATAHTKAMDFDMTLLTRWMA
jgi:hypothetical protein